MIVSNECQFRGLARLIESRLVGLDDSFCFVAFSVSEVMKHRYACDQDIVQEDKLWRLASPPPRVASCTGRDTILFPEICTRLQVLLKIAIFKPSAAMR